MSPIGNSGKAAFFSIRQFSLLSIVVVSCGGIEDLQQLRRGLERSTNISEIGVDLLNDTLLTIAPLLPRPIESAAARTDLCQQIAVHVRDSFPGASKLTEMRINFLEAAAAPGGKVVVQSTSACKFTREELGVRPR